MSAENTSNLELNDSFRLHVSASTIENPHSSIDIEEDEDPMDTQSMPDHPFSNHKSRKRKKFIECNERNKWKTKKKFKEDLISFNKILLTKGCCLSKVEITPLKPEDNENDFDVNKFELIIQNQTMDDRQEDKKKKVRECLQLKDSLFISDKNWQKLTNFQKKSFPNSTSFIPLKQIKSLRKEESQKNVLVANKYGVYKDVDSLVSWALQKIVKKLEIDSFVPLRLKFSGDGAYITRHKSILNFSFSCINDEKLCKSSEGTYVLGIFEIQKENYQSLDDCLSELLPKVKKIDSIIIENRNFSVTKYLGGDLKFLAAFMGINSAISNYPCVWCKVHKKDMGDPNKSYSILDKEKHARSIEESIKIFEEIKNKKTKDYESFGYVNKPITDCFPFHHVIPDLLHLFLRIGQKLLSLLFERIELFDGKHLNDLKKRPYLQRFIHFLEDECNINNPCYQDRKSGKINLKDFSASILEVIFYKINLEIGFDLSNEKCELKKNFFLEIQYIFKEFYILYCVLKFPVQRHIPNELNFSKIHKFRLKTVSSEPILTCSYFKYKSEQWFKNFRKLFHSNEVTVYIHVLCFHVFEFLQLYGDLNLFNQEGLEKQNDNIRRYFHQSSNKKDIAQILNKMDRNRF